MSSRVNLLATFLVVLVPTFAHAADPVDMKGRWVGKTHSIVVGKGGHWPTSTGTLEKPGLFEKDIVWEVKGQQDTRFWGVMTMSGGNERTEEPFIAELHGKDGKHVTSADTDGYLWGEVDGDRFDFCYAQAGKQSSVVSCTTLTRAH
jgi:hypothetical protein